MLFIDIISGRVIISMCLSIKPRFQNYHRTNLGGDTQRGKAREASGILHWFAIFQTITEREVNFPGIAYSRGTAHLSETWLATKMSLITYGSKSESYVSMNDTRGGESKNHDAICSDSRDRRERAVVVRGNQRRRKEELLLIVIGRALSRATLSFRVVCARH